MHGREVILAALVLGRRMSLNPDHLSVAFSPILHAFPQAAKESDHTGSTPLILSNVSSYGGFLA